MHRLGAFITFCTLWVHLRIFSEKRMVLVHPVSGPARTPIINLNLLPEHLMSKIDEILALARSRNKDWPYEGAVTPAEAYQLLSLENAVKLVDVRTNAERDWVGRAAVPDAQHGAVQWNTYPGGNANHEFIEQLNGVARKAQVILFLCRSGE